jgi:YVTN family beta-propeller protein
MLIMSVIMVASKSVTAQTIETMKGPVASNQLQVGGDPEDIAVNPVTNKIYILNPGNGTVTVLDSKSGTVKNILVGLGSCLYDCIGVDSKNNKIYVANSDDNTVSVIDGNNDTVKKTIPVGEEPTFILVTTYPTERILGYLPPAYSPPKGAFPFESIEFNEACCKIYVANSEDGTVSVIDGSNDTVENTIPLGNGSSPALILPYIYTTTSYPPSMVRFT